MKRLFFIIFIGLILIKIPAFSQENAGVDYDAIYNNLIIPNFTYDDNEDPDQITDYAYFVKSPYPLIRLSLPLNCKGVKLAPGYYLMTPKNRDGYDFVMFKQNGKITALIPIYQKQVIDPNTVYPVVKTKKSIAEKIAGFINRKREMPVAPRYAINGELVDVGKYFDLQLYQEQYLYKMLFKVEK
jgi:hypothetical protein